METVVNKSVLKKISREIYPVLILTSVLVAWTTHSIGSADFRHQKHKQKSEHSLAMMNQEEGR